MSLRARLLAALIVLGLGCAVAVSRPLAGQARPSSIAASFNGTPIAAEDYIWFSAVVSPRNVPSSGATIMLTSSTVTFTASGVSYTVRVPDAVVTLSAVAAQASTVFDSQTNTWRTTVPMGISGNVFLSGVAWKVPVNLPGGITPVTWRGTFSTNASSSGLGSQWKWGASVYSSPGFDQGAPVVKAVDGETAELDYPNQDRAGTPENVKALVIAGATGAGEASFTGSLSGGANVAFTGSTSSP